MQKPNDMLMMVPEPTGPALLTDLFRLRRQQGLDRYGTVLQACNGRDARADLVQELVDAKGYMAQLLMEMILTQRPSPADPTMARLGRFADAIDEVILLVASLPDLRTRPA
jgi:hypothetical protein